MCADFILRLNSVLTVRRVTIDQMRTVHTFDSYNS